MNTCKWNYSDFLWGVDSVDLEDFMRLFPIDEIGEDIVDTYIEDGRQEFYSEWDEYVSEWEDWGE